MTPQNKRLRSILLIAGLILLIPLLAMQFTTEVKWSLPDFVIAGFLLFGTGIFIDFTLRKVKKLTFRIVIIATILILLLLIWAELAVGIFGTPIAGN